MALAPDAETAAAEPLLGGIDTATYALRLQRAAAVSEYVVRVFRDQEGDPSAIARRDYAALTAVAGAIAIAPRPIHLDASGDLIGEPLIVMSRLPGAPLPPPDPPDRWIRQMADALATVHDTPLDRLPSDMRREETISERLERMLSRRSEPTDPLWDEVASILPEAVGHVRMNAPTLVHGDFWFGNTIWEGGHLRGIVDWDGARVGDPARDVAVARNDLAIFIGPSAADLFLERYESVRGPLTDLAYWDVHVSLGPIKWLPHWVAGYRELGVDLPLSVARARLEIWVRRALERLFRTPGVSLGLTLFVVGMGYVAWTVSADGDRWALLPGLVVAGIGMGGTWTPIFDLATRTLEPRLAGAASGVLSTIQELGAVLATAVIGAVLQNRLAIALHDQAMLYAQRLPEDFRASFVAGFSDAAKQGFEVVGAGQSGAGLELPPGVPTDVAAQLAQLAHAVFGHAFVDAMRPAMGIPLVLLLVAAVLVALVARQPKAVASPERTRAVA